jgi:hypothetical protein
MVAVQQIAAWQKRNAHVSCQAPWTLARLRDCGIW